MLHMTQILIFIPYFDHKNIFGQNLTSNAVFTIGVPEKNTILGSSHRFLEIIILPKQLCRTKKRLPVNAYK